MHASVKPSSDLEDELQALRRELSEAAPMRDEATTSDAPSGPRAEIEKVLGELQERLGDVTDDAEDMIKANPFASVAAAFLLGVLVANFMSRGK